MKQSPLWKIYEADLQLKKTKRIKVRCCWLWSIGVQHMFNWSPSSVDASTFRSHAHCLLFVMSWRGKSVAGCQGSLWVCESWLGGRRLVPQFNGIARRSRWFPSPWRGERGQRGGGEGGLSFKGDWLSLCSLITTRGSRQLCTVPVWTRSTRPLSLKEMNAF